MRMLYRALSVLSEKWVSEVRGAGTDTAITVYDRGLDSVTKVDIPLAIDIYQRAKFALVVLDEDPEGGLPPAIAGADETEGERVQRTEHTARIGVWELPSGRLLGRVNVSALGELKDVGTRRSASGEEATAARSRVANSCALALEFKSQVLPESDETDQPTSEPAVLLPTP
jgi:hypothetical protein